MPSIRICFKDPDSAGDQIADHVRDELIQRKELTADERELLFEHRVEKVSGIVNKWLKWGEYMEIEVDLETGAATVIKPS
jgi:hypothetical protein